MLLLTSDHPLSRPISVEAAALCLRDLADTNEVLVSKAANVSGILRAIADRARSLTNASYAAISTFDAQDTLDRFVYSGIDEATARRIGDPPVGRGVLGALVRYDTSFVLDSVSDHPDSCGFPPGHPAMGPFLGVPIRANNRTIGSLYMTRDPGDPPFGEAEELAANLLALQVAVRLSHALASEQEGRVALLEERGRIAHDLHDGTIQVLYAMGLESEATASGDDVPGSVRDLLRTHVDRMNQLIADIRGYINLLEADHPHAAPELSRDLSFIARTLIPAGVDTVINIKAAALQELGGRIAEDLLFIAREAISNSVRHASPTRVALDLRQDEHETALTVQDNGTGFESANVRHGLGTVSMRTRAERLGADLSVVSIPGMGTTVRVTIPRGDLLE
jgi:signal transduction histidine kinase